MFDRANVLAWDHFIQAGGELAGLVTYFSLKKHFRESDEHVQFGVKLVSVLN